MRIIKEATLVKVEVFNDGNSWSMQWDGQNYVHRGDLNSFAKLLQKIKAADDHTEPKSNRSTTYNSIAKEIASGSDRFIWVFKHMLRKLWESQEMRKIKTEKADASTAKCPTCGNKYLVQTGYCVSCKKKVAEPGGKAKKADSKDDKKKDDKKKETIEISSDVRIPGTDIILEAGDKIQIIKINEETDTAKVKKIIKDLGDSYGGSNEEQGKMVQLFRGLAFSDDPEANKFMKALDKWTTEYSNKIGEK